MKLIFIRHGETQEGKRGIILGSRGGNLTMQGKQEAKEIARELIVKNMIPDIIITSPLARAFDTAKIISSILKRRIIKDSLIRERSAGIAEGKRASDIDWETYEKKQISQRKHKEGESFLDVYKRAEKFIQKLRKEYTTKTILIISHDVCIRMCVAVLERKTIEQALRSGKRRQIIIFQMEI